VLGVALGAPVIEFLGWRDLFWIQLVLLVVSFVVVALVLPAHGRHGDGAAVGHAEGAGAMDWVGSWSLSGAVVGVMLALSMGPVLGWGSAGVACSLGVAACSVALFVHRERTAADPLIPPEYFRRRNFVFPMATRSLINFAYFGAFFLFPLMMEEVYHWGITQVGLVSLARPLLFSVSAPVAGYATVRVGERTSAAVGAALVTASMVAFAELGTAPSTVMVVVALALAGMGMGVASPAASSAQANEVDPGRFGVMSAAQLLAVQVGEVAGIQVLVTVQESLARRSPGVAHGAELLPSFRAALWLGAAVAAAGVAAALCMRRGARRAGTTR
jgi:predicted MFS family arabinose efflux permease